MKIIILFLITSLCINTLLYGHPQEINWRTMNAAEFRQIRDAEIEQSWMPECLANCCGIFGSGIIEVCEENIQLMIDYLNDKDYYHVHEMLYNFFRNEENGYPGRFELLSLIVANPQANLLLEFIINRKYMIEHLEIILIAIKANNPGAVRLIGDNIRIRGEDMTLLSTLFRKGSSSTVEMRSNVYRLLQSPYHTIKLWDDHGNEFVGTILHFEAMKGCSKLVEYLIKQKKAIVTIQDSKHRTPADIARARGSYQLALDIEQHGDEQRKLLNAGGRTRIADYRLR